MEHLRLLPLVRKGAARAARSLAVLLLCILSGCLVPGGRAPVPALNVSSAAFPMGGQIPVIYTCDGANVSPPLSWGTSPPGTVSIAILVSDPDAPGGTFIHWVAYNIPPGTREITAGGPGRNVLPAGSVQGTNDMGRTAYGGPCPPRGKPHHYHFTVSALDTSLNLSGKRDGRVLEGAIGGHLLARGEVVGIYQRA
ncbi:MAG TPA: YbhB/YbcL family Raf kinase inhibitor-like protein [Methanomicrobiales archaeon]|nr:YbhB/YbcL family Raf kinase inhibitor-like protein [Methanomicrobiales archaeon]